MNLCMKRKQIHRCREQTCSCQGGGEVGEGSIRRLGLVGANHYIQNGLKKDLLFSTGNYIQYPVINHNRKEDEKESIYMCGVSLVA